MKLYLTTICMIAIYCTNDCNVVFASTDHTNKENILTARHVNYEKGINWNQYDVPETNGFPKSKIYPYDPVNHKMYQQVIVGPTFKSKNPLSDYDYWRYITVYNIEKQKERVAYLPYFEEDCHDFSIFMAQWDETKHFKVIFNSSVGVSKLGLSTSVGMSVEQGVSFTATRRVQAVRNVHAKHFPYKVSETWEGVTFIQVFVKKTKSHGYLLKSRWESYTDSYPYTFSIDNQNVGFKVVREVQKYCAGYDASDDPVRHSPMYLPER